MIVRGSNPIIREEKALVGGRPGFHKAIRQLVAALALLLALSGARPARAQWLTQTNVIPPGWSAVYLFVDASGTPLNSLVGGNPNCPIDQIWQWKTLPTSQQYVTTPEQPLIGSSQWLNWFRSGQGISTLAALTPNAAFLVHSTATTNFTWAVQGVPVPPSYLWDNTGLNLIGFSTPPANPPTFQNFLAPAPVLAAGVQIFQYVGGAFGAFNPEPVFSQTTTLVTPGQALWMSDTNLNNTYFGPFKLTLPSPQGLVFGAGGSTLTIQILNQATQTVTITAQLVNSEPWPEGQTPIVGAPPLMVEGSVNPTNGLYSYTALAPAGNGSATNSFSWTLPPAGQPGSAVSVTLGVNRFAMTNSAGSLYAGILQFTDSLGLLQLNIPVSAQAANNAGLWVGAVSVSQVGNYLKSYATNADGSYQYSVTTNAVYTTNASPVVATNLSVVATAAYATNTAAYCVTNETVDLYSFQETTIVTNGVVLGTNWLWYVTETTNTVITTTNAGFGFSLVGGDIIWQPQNTTNTTVYSVTNGPVVTLVTNLIAPVTSPPAAVPVTNTVTYLASFNTILVTNGLFLAPVTNILNGATQVISAATNSVEGLAYNLVITNVSGLVATNITFETTNYTLTTITTQGRSTTNTYPGAVPAYVLTNGPNELVFYWVTNSATLTNSYSTSFITNAFAITNNYVVGGGQTNLVGSVTNQVFNAITPGPFGTEPVVTTNYLSYGSFWQPAATLTAALSYITNSSYQITGLNTNLGSVPVAYPLRLILFNDGTNCSLLQRVYYGVKRGSTTNMVVATTESALDPGSLGTARRISSAMMPFTAANNPWPFSGGALAQGNVLSCTFTEAYDDQASNPFLHTYHPDHNNLNYATPGAPPVEQPEGVHSYGISRTVNLFLTPNNLDFISLSKGNSQLAGQYTESITLTGVGGAQRTFNTAGIFLLQNISQTATLTTQ